MDKKLFLVLTLTTLTVAGFHYMSYRQSTASSNSSPEALTPGKGFRIPSKEELLKPLEREINFSDKKVTELEELTEIETDLATFAFSNYGATLAALNFKKRFGKDKTPLKTILPTDFFTREESTFILATGENSPYFYKLAATSEQEDTFSVVYKASIHDWTITKTYRVYKKNYRIDLSIGFENHSKGATPFAPRLFIAGPFLAELSGDVLSGFTYNSETKTLDKIPQAQELENAWLMPQIFGIEDRYFVHALIGDNETFVQRGYFKKMGENKLFMILEGPLLSEKSTFDLSFYFGPKDVSDIAAVDVRLEDLLSFGWFSWLCKLLLRLLEWLYKYVGNFGFAIILLTLLIKIPLLPLTLKSSEVMEKTQRYQPALARIQAKYKGDVQKLHEETMKFYREHGMTPFGPIVGCLPYLIDVPIMFALYRVLGNYLDLYHAPFIFWIKDLSVQDPYYVLPILMGAAMLWQQRLTPIADEKQRILGFVMAILFTGLFANFASGVVLYWCTKNILTLGETYLRKAIS